MTDEHTETVDTGTDPILDGAGEEDEESFEPMTFYLQKETQRQVKRWLKQVELDHPDIDERAQKAHEYEAIVQVAMEHEDEVINRVREMAGITS